MEETTARRTGRLHDAWATRPARPRDGRMVAGVAAAIAERYGLDPVLVRVAFAVAAFYGPGIPLYLIGCAALPDARSTGSGRARAVLTTVLLVGAAVGMAFLLFGGEGGWLAPLMVCAGLLVVLHLTRGGTAGGAARVHAPAPPAGNGATTAPVRATPLRTTPAPGGTTAQAAAPNAPTTQAAPVSAPQRTDGTVRPGDGRDASGHGSGTSGGPGTSGSPGTSGGLGTSDGAGPSGEGAGPSGGGAAAGGTAVGDTGTAAVVATHGPADAVHDPADPATGDRPSPPSWDPLGVAPFAWDLPEPGPERAPEPASGPRRSRITPVTLALALLAGGVAGALALTFPGTVVPAAAPGAALAVVGIGLVTGAFRHAGRWLLPFAVLLAIATWLASAVPWADLRGGVGTIADAPRSAAAVAPEYRRGVGDIALDLSGLDLATPPGAPVPTVRTSAQVGVGSISVTVPQDADIVVRGTSALGDVTVDGQSRSGDAASLTVVDDGPDGPGGGRIEIDAHATLGSVTVGRG